MHAREGPEYIGHVRCCGPMGFVIKKGLGVSNNTFWRCKVAWLSILFVSLILRLIYTTPGKYMLDTNTVERTDQSQPDTTPALRPRAPAVRLQPRNTTQEGLDEDLTQKTRGKLEKRLLSSGQSCFISPPISYDMVLFDLAMRSHRWYLRGVDLHAVTAHSRV